MRDIYCESWKPCGSFKRGVLTHWRENKKTTDLELSLDWCQAITPHMRLRPHWIIPTFIFKYIHHNQCFGKLLTLCWTYLRSLAFESVELGHIKLRVY